MKRKEMHAITKSRLLIKEVQQQKHKKVARQSVHI